MLSRPNGYWDGAGSTLAAVAARVAYRGRAPPQVSRMPLHLSGRGKIILTRATADESTRWAAVARIAEHVAGWLLRAAAQPLQPIVLP